MKLTRCNWTNVLRLIIVATTILQSHAKNGGMFADDGMMGVHMGLRVLPSSFLLSANPRG
jgi:hypothetical protein